MTTFRFDDPELRRVFEEVTNPTGTVSVITQDMLEVDRAIAEIAVAGRRYRSQLRLFHWHLGADRVEQGCLGIRITEKEAVDFSQANVRAVLGDEGFRELCSSLPTVMRRRMRVDTKATRHNYRRLRSSLSISDLADWGISDVEAETSPNSMFVDFSSDFL